jgi:hypothetical protein
MPMCPANSSCVVSNLYRTTPAARGTLECAYSSAAGSLATRFFGSACDFPVSNQSTDLSLGVAAHVSCGLKTGVLLRLSFHQFPAIREKYRDNLRIRAFCAMFSRRIRNWPENDQGYVRELSPTSDSVSARPYRRDRDIEWKSCGRCCRGSEIASHKHILHPIF